MKYQYVDHKFSPASLEMIRTAETICNQYARMGYDLSLRQLYYQFVAHHGLPNKEQSYKSLGDLISNARLAGLIDWTHIQDRGRETVANSHWNSPASILRSAAYSFALDKWQDQPEHVEVMVEKQALEGVLQPVCENLDIPFTANKGYSSSSALYSVAMRLKECRRRGKDVHIIYLGDHDPSGIDMTRDVEERLELLSEGTVYVHRVALNMPQIEEYNPPENPAKLTDSRANAYIDKYGDSSWELDALAPEVLARLVEEEVLRWRDDEKYEARELKERTYKQELEALAAQYDQRD